MIKFQKHYVTNGTIKARVSYRHFNLITEDVMAVTLYAKSFEDGRNLGKILSSEYENNSEPMTDYFEQGHARIKSTNPLYEAAKLRCAA